MASPGQSGTAGAAAGVYGIPRPPVIFCWQGEAREVVRREAFEDLTLRDL